jgi:succinyl-CoA:acetate CoA-transferase
MLELIDYDKVNIVSGTAITPSPEGLEKFYKNLDKYKKKIVLRPQEISNNPEIIRRLGVIALNTAIEVDIYGNVNSTHILGRKMMNGIGGSGDFARNSYISIFFTESTAKNGNVSSIVPCASHVDHTEHDVDIIITEEGVADLRGLSPKERALTIIKNCSNKYYKPMLMDYYKTITKINASHTPKILKEVFSWHERFEKNGTMRI